MWAVVHFFADDSVEAVPNHWFKDNKCAWPIKSPNVNRLIEKRVIVNGLEFQYLNARLLSNNISMPIAAIIFYIYLTNFR